ncbi:hypothetical protein ACFC5A_29960, partial [Streptomyces yangpuensis]
MPAPDAVPASFRATAAPEGVPVGRGSRPEDGSAAGPAAQPSPVERDAGALPAPDAVPASAGQAFVHATAAAEDVPAGPGVRPEGGSAPQSATAARRAGAEAVVPAAREAAESEAQPAVGAGAANSGVPGPGAAEVVARAVARAMDEDDTQDLPNVAAPRRGAAVTEVPLHLPF